MADFPTVQQIAIGEAPTSVAKWFLTNEDMYFTAISHGFCVEEVAEVHSGPGDTTVTETLVDDTPAAPVKKTQKKKGTIKKKSSADEA
jgi:hypothetical protein